MICTYATPTHTCKCSQCRAARCAYAHIAILLHCWGCLQKANASQYTTYGYHGQQQKPSWTLPCLTLGARRRTFNATSTGAPESLVKALQVARGRVHLPEDRRGTDARGLRQRFAPQTCSCQPSPRPAGKQHAAGCSCTNSIDEDFCKEEG